MPIELFASRTHAPYSAFNLRVIKLLSCGPWARVLAKRLEGKQRPLQFALARYRVFLFLLLVYATGARPFEAAAATQNTIARPVIFIPGIFGSKLCKDGDDKQLLWGSVSAFSSFPRLKLREDGKTSDIKVEPCGPIDEFVYFGSYGQDIYGRFLSALQQAGYEKEKTLFVFAYDWRLSNFDNAERLRVEIEKYAVRAKLEPHAKFDIIAHSMGGLIAMILANADHPRIARLITVATPYRGSIKLFSSLETGWGWVQRRFVTMREVRDTALSFPSIYELLPTYRNCCALGAGVPPGTALDLSLAKDARRLAWFQSLPIENLESKLQSARNLQAIVNSQPRIYVARLHGVQQKTPEKVYLSSEDHAERIIRKTVSSWLGDGTVMDYSAMPENELARLPGSSSHERIMSDESVISQILKSLDERRPREKISGTVVQCMTSAGNKLEIDGATVEGVERLVSPGQEMSIELTIRSSAQLPHPASLQGTLLDGRVVSPQAHPDLSFEPVGQTEFDNERTREGVIYFHAARFTAKFSAPITPGPTAVEVRCAPDQNKAIAAWDFRVAE